MPGYAEGSSSSNKRKRDDKTSQEDIAAVHLAIRNQVRSQQEQSDEVIATQLEQEWQRLYEQEGDGYSGGLQDLEDIDYDQSDSLLKEWILDTGVTAVVTHYQSWSRLEPILKWLHRQLLWFGKRFFSDASSATERFMIRKRSIMRVQGNRWESWQSQSCSDVLGESTQIKLSDGTYCVGLHVLLFAVHAAGNPHIAKLFGSRAARNDISRLELDDIYIPYKGSHVCVVYAHLSPVEGKGIIGMTRDSSTRMKNYRGVRDLSRKMARAYEKLHFSDWIHGTVHVGNSSTPAYALFAIESGHIFIGDNVSFGYNTNYIDACRWPAILTASDIEIIWNAFYNWLNEVPGRVIPSRGPIPASGITDGDKEVVCIAKSGGLKKIVSSTTIRNILHGLAWNSVTSKLNETKPLKAEHFTSELLPLAWRSGEERDEHRELRAVADYSYSTKLRPAQIEGYAGLGGAGWAKIKAAKGKGKEQ